MSEGCDRSGRAEGSLQCSGSDDEGGGHRQHGLVEDVDEDGVVRSRIAIGHRIERVAHDDLDAWRTAGHGRDAGARTRLHRLRWRHLVRRVIGACLSLRGRHVDNVRAEAKCRVGSVDDGGVDLDGTEGRGLGDVAREKERQRPRAKTEEEHPRPFAAAGRPVAESRERDACHRLDVFVCHVAGLDVAVVAHARDALYRAKRTVRAAEA